jgi:hypothetical protein
MNAYMYHMLLQARESHWKEFQGEPPNCPFCTADARQTGEDVIAAGITSAGFAMSYPRSLCFNCPLINLFSLDSLHILMEDCEDMGRHALQIYEEAGE